MPEPDREDLIRRRQRGRALAMALALGADVVLLYFITIARMSGGS